MVERGGVAFLWMLNDHCDKASLSRQLDAFQEAGIGGLMLHPRDGLLAPYGGEDWFALIRWLVVECGKRGIEPILYDEDPYPSGNAGGLIVLEHPEYLAHAMKPFLASEETLEDGLFVFPAGRLCWAGIVFSDGRKAVDLTSRVGLIRRQWEKAEWDSRWYYPATPIYPHPRAFAHHPEFALRDVRIPQGGRLVAVVAQPTLPQNGWGTLVDSLNPLATHVYLNFTHERYRQTLGDLLGREVRAIFTDEPKPPSLHSWTPGLFEGFQKAYGYDLRPRLIHLFEGGNDPGGMRVRLDYREWITRRFDQAWMRPVSEWCRKQGLAMIGHLSPEEDPISQAATLGNIFPTQRRLSLGGFDVIIPAIGDARHRLLNVGALIAASTAQQNRQPGVCCECLGACGTDIPMETIGRTLSWQILHGVTLPTIHGAFSSGLGLRRYEAPDDYGTNSKNWESIRSLCQDATPFFQSTARATQRAPVALLWPIASFQAQGETWQKEDVGARRDLLLLVQECLEHQIGLHFLDEADLARARTRGNRIHLGRAAYEWILLPSLTVLNQATWEALRRFRAAGIPMASAGDPPQWVRPRKGGPLRALKSIPWPQYSLRGAMRQSLLTQLPRLLELPENLRRDFHVTSWKKASRDWLFLMHVGKKARRLALGGGTEEDITPGELLELRRKGHDWAIAARLSPRQYPDLPPKEELAPCGEWEMRAPGQKPLHSPHPLAAYQILPPRGAQVLRMVVTENAHLGGGKLAKRITYLTRIKPMRAFQTATLLVEPTLMRGQFTLEAGGRQWKFCVRDTGTTLQEIDLTAILKPKRDTVLRFILHEPEAMDGIKHEPRIVLDR